MSAHETRLNLAIEAYAASLVIPGADKAIYSELAIKFDVDAGTLRKRVIGATSSRSIANKHHQALTDGEEQAILGLI